MKNLQANPSAGFTLVELVVVIVVLSSVALVVIPKVTGLEQESRLAVSVSNIADINRTMASYTAMTKGKIPDGWDSLLDAADSQTIYAGNGNPLENSGVWSGWLTSSQISNSEYFSMIRVTSNVVGSGPSGSLVTVYDHDATESDALASTDGSVARTLASGDYCAFVSDTASSGLAVYDRFNLTPSPEYRLLALGIGPHCTIVGNSSASLAECPIADDISPNQQYSYRRFVAIFKVYTDQSSSLFAEYLGAVTSYGKNGNALRAYMLN